MFFFLVQFVFGLFFKVIEFKVFHIFEKYNYFVNKLIFYDCLIDFSFLDTVIYIFIYLNFLCFILLTCI